MNKTEKNRIISQLMDAIPDGLKGAEKADIFVGFAVELGLTHLLANEALPNYENGIALPDKAPVFYQDREDKSEKPAEFIKRVYAPWLGEGLAKHHLLQLDKPLYMALANWLKKNEMPDWLNLPTKKEIADRDLNQLGVGRGENLPYPSYDKGLKDKLRLYNAARNRK